MFKKLVFGASLLIFPAIASAQSLTYFQNVVIQARDIINLLIPTVIGIAVLVFLWGLVKYVVSKDDDQKKEARSVMIYGILTLFVMVSIWGLVAIVQNLFGITEQRVPTAPPIPNVGTSR